MRTISKIFLTGLLAILPIGVTAYLLYWAGSSAESGSRQLLEWAAPGRLVYFPGMGMIALAVAVMIVGLLMRSWVIQRCFAALEGILKRIPLVKTLYGAIKDLLSLFSGSKERGLSQVVMVTLGDSNVRLLGFLTRDDFGDLPSGIGDAGKVAVYLPMSYQLGGFTTIVPREAVEPIDMPLEDAMRFAIAAGVQQKPIEA